MRDKISQSQLDVLLDVRTLEFDLKVDIRDSYLIRKRTCKYHLWVNYSDNNELGKIVEQLLLLKCRNCRVGSLLFAPASGLMQENKSHFLAQRNIYRTTHIKKLYSLKNIKIFIDSKTSAGSNKIFHMTKIIFPSMSFPIHSRKISTPSCNNLLLNRCEVSYSIDRITASHCLVATSPIVCFDVSVCFEIALMTLFYY